MLIKLKDVHGCEFRLLKTRCREWNHSTAYALRKDVANALRYGNSLTVRYTDPNRLCTVIVRDWSEGVLSIGCHGFEGKARAAILRWLRAAK